MIASKPYSRLWRSAQHPHFAAQAAGFERLLHDRRHVVEIERLVQIVIRAVLHRLDGILDGRERRHQDDQRVRRQLLDLPQDRETIAVGQPIVQQHEVDGRRRAVDRTGRGARFEDRVAVSPEPFAQRPANEFLVVDDQQSCLGHGSHSLLSSASVRLAGVSCKPSARRGSRRNDEWPIDNAYGVEALAEFFPARGFVRVFDPRSTTTATV